MMFLFQVLFILLLSLAASCSKSSPDIFYQEIQGHSLFIFGIPPSNSYVLKTQGDMAELRIGYIEVDILKGRLYVNNLFYGAISSFSKIQINSAYVSVNGVVIEPALDVDYIAIKIKNRSRAQGISMRTDVVNGVPVKVISVSYSTSGSGDEAEIKTEYSIVRLRGRCIFDGVGYSRCVGDNEYIHIDKLGVTIMPLEN